MFPGLAAIDRMEELAGMGRMDELAKEVRSLAWLQGRYGDAAALADPDLGARTDPARPDRHYFTVLFVSDVDASIWDRAVDEMHTFRRPDDTLVYEAVLVRSFDAALACVLLNNDVQAVVMRPDVPLRSEAAFGLFDGMMDEFDAEYGLTGATEYHRARVLATVIRRVRPHLDLYLTTDEALPDSRTRPSWPSTEPSTATSRAASCT